MDGRESKVSGVIPPFPRPSRLTASPEEYSPPASVELDTPDRNSSDTSVAAAPVEIPASKFGKMSIESILNPTPFQAFLTCPDTPPENVSNPSPDPSNKLYSTSVPSRGTPSSDQGAEAVALAFPDGKLLQTSSYQIASSSDPLGPS